MSFSIFLAHLAEFRNIFVSWQVFSALCIALFTRIVLQVLKYARFRQKYNQIWPGKKIRFFNIFGNLSEFPWTDRGRNGFSLLVYHLQYTSGYNLIFKDKPFWCFWLSYTPILFTSKAETVQALISGTDNLEKGWIYDWVHPWLGLGLLTSKGSKWKSSRKLLTPAFHFEILKDFIPIFNNQAHVLVKHLQKETTKDSTDIVKPITLCSLDIICETTLGVTIHAQGNQNSQYVQSVKRAGEIIMSRIVNVLHSVDFIFNFTKTGKEFKRNIKILHNFTMSIIQEKKMKLLSGNQDVNKKKRMALMDLLLEHHIKTKSLTEEDIREEIDTFVFEGHDTVSMGISWALYLIGLHKDVQEKLHEEMDSIFGDDTERHANTEDLNQMKYLDRLLKECQRLFPSVPLIARKIDKDATIDGYPVLKGTTIFIHMYSLFRDEKWFPNSEKFDPDRFLPQNCANRHPFTYIPFSAGPRNCIGQIFALLEEKIVMSTLLRHYTFESLDQRDKLPPAPELTLKPPLPIRIKIRPRENTSSNQN